MLGRRQWGGNTDDFASSSDDDDSDHADTASLPFTLMQPQQQQQQQNKASAPVAAAHAAAAVSVTTHVVSAIAAASKARLEALAARFTRDALICIAEPSDPTSNASLPKPHPQPHSTVKPVLSLRPLSSALSLRGLTRLSLAYCGLTDAALMRTVVPALLLSPAAKTLTHLDLSHNALGPAAAFHVLDTLVAGGSLSAALMQSVLSDAPAPQLPQLATPRRPNFWARLPALLPAHAQNHWEWVCHLSTSSLSAMGMQSGFAVGNSNGRSLGGGGGGDAAAVATLVPLLAPALALMLAQQQRYIRTVTGPDIEQGSGHTHPVGDGDRQCLGAFAAAASALGTVPEVLANLPWPNAKTSQLFAAALSPHPPKTTTTATTSTATATPISTTAATSTAAGAAQQQQSQRPQQPQQQQQLWSPLCGLIASTAAPVPPMTALSVISLTHNSYMLTPAPASLSNANSSANNNNNGNGNGSADGSVSGATAAHPSSKGILSSWLTLAHPELDTDATDLTTATGARRQRLLRQQQELQRQREAAAEAAAAADPNAVKAALYGTEKSADGANNNGEKEGLDAVLARISALKRDEDSLGALLTTNTAESLQSKGGDSQSKGGEDRLKEMLIAQGVPMSFQFDWESTNNNPSSTGQQSSSPAAASASAAAAAASGCVESVAAVRARHSLLRSLVTWALAELASATNDGRRYALSNLKNEIKSHSIMLNRHTRNELNLIDVVKTPLLFCNSSFVRNYFV